MLEPLNIADLLELDPASTDHSLLCSAFDRDDVPFASNLFDEPCPPALWRPPYERLFLPEAPHQPLNVLLGRTVDDCFKDFPSPTSTPSSTSSSAESTPNGDIDNPLPESADATIQAVSDQFTTHMHFNSPQGVADSNPLHSESASPSAIGGTPSTSRESCDPFSPASYSSGLVPLTHSEATHFLGVRNFNAKPPSMNPLPKRAPPIETSLAGSTASTLAAHVDPLPAKVSPGVRRSARRLVLASHGPGEDNPGTGGQDQSGMVERCKDGLVTTALVQSAEPCSQDVRDLEASHSRPKRPRTLNQSPVYREDDDYDVEDERPRKKGRKAPARYDCPKPGCKKTFTRAGDVERHLKNASVHMDDGQVDDNSRCSKCGENLSRPDARKRHELKGSCGKRTIRRKRIPHIPQD